jgi:hypothetical protein
MGITRFRFLFCFLATLFNTQVGLAGGKPRGCFCAGRAETIGFPRVRKPAGLFSAASGVG